MVIVIIIGIVIVLFSLYLFCIIKSTKKDKEFLPLLKNYIAHRGLYNNEDVPENSLSSFELAVKNDYGIELDVHLTKDKELVVVHDSNLLRMCNIDKNVEELTYDEVKFLSLLNTDQKILKFTEALEIIGGKVPLFVEIKYQGNYLETARKTARVLDNYKGVYAIQSFQPKVVRWFYKNRPDIIRGQLCSNFIKSNNSLIKKLSPSHLIFDFYSKPDFIAYNYKQKENLSLKLVQKITNQKIQVWAIDNYNDFNNDKNKYDMVIFEKIKP